MRPASNREKFSSVVVSVMWLDFLQHLPDVRPTCWRIAPVPEVFENAEFPVAVDDGV